MSKDMGGPAFPEFRLEFKHRAEYHVVTREGAMLWDMYAAAALTGYLSNPDASGDFPRTSTAGLAAIRDYDAATPAGALPRKPLALAGFFIRRM